MTMTENDLASDLCRPVVDLQNLLDVFEEGTLPLGMGSPDHVSVKVCEHFYEHFTKAR